MIHSLGPFNGSLEAVITVLAFFATADLYLKIKRCYSPAYKVRGILLRRLTEKAASRKSTIVALSWRESCASIQRNYKVGQLNGSLFQSMREGKRIKKVKHFTDSKIIAAKLLTSKVYVIFMEFMCTGVISTRAQLFLIQACATQQKQCWK